MDGQFGESTSELRSQRDLAADRGVRPHPTDATSSVQRGRADAGLPARALAARASPARRRLTMGQIDPQDPAA